VTIAALLPTEEYSAIAERYASWQTQSRLRRAEDVAAVVYYEEDEAAQDVVADVEESHVLVIVDPLVIIDDRIATRLRDELEQRGAELIAPAGTEPLLYLCDADTLRRERRTLRRAIESRNVTIVETITARKWKREPPPDLLPAIPAAAVSVLHVGCADGSLGERIKQRQPCRVVGIELNRAAAAIAKRRIDDVYIGDVGDIVAVVNEEFDCVVTSGVLEHLHDPWSLLAALRRRTAAGGALVAAIPNIANPAAIAALPAGRFDVAKQVRFFTRDSVAEMLDIAGWTPVTIDEAAAQFVVIARRG
jgi:2-polyprenyl-3-methyl-5-hydroxy-6-metoxy-1,4-benzoquinol methylase